MSIIVGFALSVIIITSYVIWEITQTDFHYIIKGLFIVALMFLLTFACIWLYDYINTSDPKIYRDHYRSVGY